MTRVVLLGAGKIGRMITRFLTSTGEYDLLVVDASEQQLSRIEAPTQVIDASHPHELEAAVSGRDVVISALSFRHNPAIARAALQAGASYFDLTEDVATTREVKEIATQARPGQIFMPQCGLAPGFISIIAYHLACQFERLTSVRMRVGALPQFPNNALKYNLTWSTDGLINEYCNLCEAIHEGRRREILALEGLEHFSLDGARYEAFNTSGGLGTLCETLEGDVEELNYKTIRYPGHRELAAFLVNDLRLGERREILRDILESAIPATFQDVVITFCTVSGTRKGQFVEISDARKIYSRSIGNEWWSAIQITTAAGLCAVVDLHREGKLPETGFVRQEQVSFEEFMANRFGRHFESELSRSSPIGWEDEAE